MKRMARKDGTPMQIQESDQDSGATSTPKNWYARQRQIMWWNSVMCA